MHTNISFLVIFTFCINYCVSKKYYNYTLFRSIPVEDIHLEFLNNLTSMHDVNFWRPPGMIYKPVDFVVSPLKKEVFLREANNIGLYLTAIIKDVQRAFDMQTVKTYIRTKTESFDWHNFFRLNDIYQWLVDLAKAHPKEMEILSIGKTYEYRDIMAVKIALRGSKLRSKVIVEGGIHAREWIAPAFVSYLIHQILLAPTSKNPALMEIATTYEWYFVPVLNPDGYEFSHTEDRLWRKNRHGMGVDLNRNFDYAFGTNAIGVVSHNVTSSVYCGTKAFSEQESKAMAQFVESKRRGLEFYLAFHSYGHYMILPYGDLKTHTENFDEVKQMCDQAKVRIASKYNTQYTSGTAHETAGYLTSGDSGCWVKQKFKVPYVILFELRDNGTHGFALPPDQILPTCRETMDGIISLLTPRTPSYKYLRENIDSSEETSILSSMGETYILDKIVIVFNVVLFIIVRFD